MNTTNQTPEQKQKKVNQLIFVEYEKPTQDGHIVTVVDSYRNVIARVHRSFNEQTKKYEFTAYDHAGKEMSKGEQLWQIKKDLSSQREKLLEDAHQRRIAAKQKKETQSQTQEKTNAVEQPVNSQQPTKEEQRTAETKELRNKKTKQKNKESEIER